MFQMFGKTVLLGFMENVLAKIFLKNSFISASGKCLSELVLQLPSLLIQNVKLKCKPFIFSLLFTFSASQSN